jgi:hypothetical protein
LADAIRNGNSIVYYTMDGKKMFSSDAAGFVPERKSAQAYIFKTHSTQR